MGRVVESEVEMKTETETEDKAGAKAEVEIGCSCSSGLLHRRSLSLCFDLTNERKRQ